MPSAEQWKHIAHRFEFLWNLPNCIGALDGKPIGIKKFPRGGSTDYNDKLFHSVVLMARWDTDGLFTMVETGFAGRNSDGDIFRASAMKFWLINLQLNIPPPCKLPYDENDDFLFPY